MKVIGETCRRAGAMGTFLRNRHDDLRSRVELELYKKGVQLPTRLRMNPSPYPRHVSTESHLIYSAMPKDHPRPGEDSMTQARKIIELLSV